MTRGDADIEVFVVEGEGWYWWERAPGAKPVGPFKNAGAAFEDARKDK
jgi:hypothetical protein